MNNDSLNNLNNMNTIQDINNNEIKELKPKKNKTPMIIFIILIVIILGLGGYILFDKVFKNNTNNTNTNEDNISVLDTSSSLVNDIFNKFTNGYLSDCNKELEVYFNNKEISNNDIKNRDAFNIIMNLVTKDNKDMIISGDIVLNKAKELFGDNYTFTNQTYDNSIVYSSETNSYTINLLQSKNSCSNSNGDLSKIVSAKMINDDLELEVRVIFSGDNKYIYYSDYNRNKKLNSLGDLKFDNFVLNDDDYDKGDLYKIVFSKINDNYVFKSSKLVSETLYTSKEVVIDDIEFTTILNQDINILEVMTQNNFVVPNLYKEKITNISDENKLLTVLNYIYQTGKFTKVITPSENISYYITSNNLTSDKLIGSITLSNIKTMYDNLYSSSDESIESKEKFQYTSTCPTFIYDSVDKTYYAYLTCTDLNTIKNMGYTYKYSIIGDKINVYRAVGYKDNDIVYTSYKDKTKLSDVESKNFKDINSTNYNNFDKFMFQFTLDNAKEFKFLSVTN